MHGGTPVRDRLLPYGRQDIDEDDIAAVVETLRSDWLTTGPKVDEFEEAFAAWVGARYAVSFSSGTAALHGAAFAAGLGTGDEAITSPMTFAATANCILYQGAKPVFTDVCGHVEHRSREVLKRVTPRTKALLPVDYAGHPAQLDELHADCRPPRAHHHRRRVPCAWAPSIGPAGGKYFAHDCLQLSSGETFDYRRRRNGHN